MNTRAIAAKAILDILRKKYSLLTLENKISNQNLSGPDKSFVKLLCYEFFRNFFSLEKITTLHISNTTKLEAKILIMLGILQILEINQPNYACINETVSACKSLKITWATKFVNGVLRKILRNIESINKQYTKYKEFEMPEWLISELKKQYPNNFLEVIKAMNHKTDMFIRLNQAKDPDKVINHLKEKQVQYSLTELSNCIKLHQPIDIKNDTLFKDGYFSVQDISAQYTGWIINPQTNDKILDACAAPGGKTTHLVEINPSIDIHAVDILDKRINLLKESIIRVAPKNKVNIIKHDLTKPLNGTFNKIILDAPCSAIGTIKKNPDIKVVRTLENIKSIKITQSQILQQLWDNNLEEGGYLLYVTCSILEQENQTQIESFLNINKNAELTDIKILDQYKINYGYQILPSEDKGDGFYYCLLKKVKRLDF